MNLVNYNDKYIKLINKDNKSYKGYSYYCDKDDYEAEEDGLEMRVGKDIWIFYESDIKSIEILD